MHPFKKSADYNSCRTEYESTDQITEQKPKNQTENNCGEQLNSHTGLLFSLEKYFSTTISHCVVIFRSLVPSPVDLSHCS